MASSLPPRIEWLGTRAPSRLATQPLLATAELDLGHVWILFGRRVREGEAAFERLEEVAVPLPPMADVNYFGRRIDSALF